MMKFTAIIVLFISISALASGLDATPGLWEIEFSMTTDGKKFDPMDEVKKQIANLPEDQKKMVLEQLKNTFSTGKEVNQVCFTKEMLGDDVSKAIESADEDDDCDHKIQSKSSRKVVSTFKCKSGVSGTSTWEVKNSKNMYAKMVTKDKSGKTGEIEYKAKFIKAKCD